MNILRLIEDTKELKKRSDILLLDAKQFLDQLQEDIKNENSKQYYTIPDI